MLIIPYQKNYSGIFGIQLSKSYPKILEYDITPAESEYSWERIYRDPYIIPKPNKKIRFSKVDYYLIAFKHNKQRTLHRLIKYNGNINVIHHIEDLPEIQKEFLILQL